MMSNVVRLNDSNGGQIVGAAGVMDSLVDWAFEKLLLAALVSAGMVPGKRSLYALGSFPSVELTPELEDGRRYSFRRDRHESPVS
jgi:hypothetical protein